MPGPGRRFKKGQPPPPGAGRPKGSQNKVTKAVKDFFLDLTSDPAVQDAVRDQIISGQRGAGAVFLGAAAHVLGSPKSSVDLSITPSMGNLLALALKNRNAEPKKKAS